MFGVVAANAGADTIYVDDDAPIGGDGTSWPTAYKYLQDALHVAVTGDEIAVPGDEIHVAGGTYKPDEDEAGNVTSGNREDTFQLVRGVKLYGGYRGCLVGDCGGGDPDDRDIDLYETTLTGDLNGDDGPDFTNNDENSYHVVTGNGLNAWTRLDGFTVTQGNANGWWPHDRGGGMCNSYVSPDVVNCRFRGNWAYFGGGMCNIHSWAAVTECTFVENSALDGGGMFNGPNGLPKITRCVFQRNGPMSRGGGVYNFMCDARLTECVFLHNSASFGAGIFNDGMSPGGNPTLINCMFTGNMANSGGGMYSQPGSLPTATNCTFSSNSAIQDGGGIADFGALTATSCILWGNIDNGGMDESAQIYVPKSSLLLNYSCIQGLTGALGGVGNLSNVPLFVDADGPDGTPGTDDDNLRLSPASPCINMGDPDFVPEPDATELDGHARILCGRVDMGTYEYGFGDYTCDRSVNLSDFAALQRCFTGFGGGPYGEGCEAFDLEYDGHVDLNDFGVFQRQFTGSP